MIKLSNYFTYVGAFLTLRCNLGCDYCLNDYDGINRKREEVGGEDWIKALNKLDLKKIPITFQGGEPTLHPDFYEILNGIRREFYIDLLTNLQFEIEEFLEQVSPSRINSDRSFPDIPLRVSFHPGRMNLKETLEKMVILRGAEFNTGLFAVNDPLYPEAIEEASRKSEEQGIYFSKKDFLGWRNGKLYGSFKYPLAVDGQRKKCECRTKELIIGPDLNVFRCNGDLYHNNSPLYNLRERKSPILSQFISCGNYGVCNPCDVREEVEFEDSAVEIVKE